MRQTPESISIAEIVEIDRAPGGWNITLEPRAVLRAAIPEAVMDTRTTITCPVDRLQMFFEAADADAEIDPEDSSIRRLRASAILHKLVGLTVSPQGAGVWNPNEEH